MKIHSKDLWFGNANGCIIGLFNDAPQILKNFSCCLVTTLDSQSSNFNVTHLQSEISRAGATGVVTSTYLAFDALEFETMVRKGFFSGFDEIWFFAERSKGAIFQLPPSNVILVGPEDLRQGISESLANWMKISGSTLGLGNGIGLNYITPSESLASTIDAVNKET